MQDESFIFTHALAESSFDSILGLEYVRTFSAIGDFKDAVMQPLDRYDLALGSITTSGQEQRRISLT